MTENAPLKLLAYPPSPGPPGDDGLLLLADVTLQ
jgi:hypothetical protein